MIYTLCIFIIQHFCQLLNVLSLQIYGYTSLHLDLTIMTNSLIYQMAIYWKPTYCKIILVWTKMICIFKAGFLLLTAVLEIDIKNRVWRDWGHAEFFETIATDNSCCNGQAPQKISGNSAVRKFVSSLINVRSQNDPQNKPIYSQILFEKKGTIIIDLLMYNLFQDFNWYYLNYLKK